MANMQGVTTSSFSRQNLQGTLADTFRTKIETSNPYWKKWGFTEKTSNQAFQEYEEYSGLGPAAEHEELQTLKVDAITKGYIIRINQTAYGVMMLVSQLAMKLGQVEKAVQGAESIAESLVLCQELRCASFFGNAFSTTTQLFPDAQPLCSTSNKLPRGGTYSNRMASSTPSEASIEQMLITAAKMPAGNGYPSAVMLEKLIGPVEYKWRVKRILKSELDPNSANNTINAIKDEGLSYEANPFAESTSNWFGLTNAKVGHMVIWVTKPEQKQYEFKERRSEVFDGYQVFGIGCPHKRKVIGNPL